MRAPEDEVMCKGVFPSSSVLSLYLSLCIVYIISRFHYIFTCSRVALESLYIYNASNYILN